MSQYFQKSCFPTMAYCIFCDMSQFTTPHPPPLSGAQIRSIPAPDKDAVIARAKHFINCMHSSLSVAEKLRLVYDSKKLCD